MSWTAPSHSHTAIVMILKCCRASDSLSVFLVLLWVSLVRNAVYSSNQMKILKQIELPIIWQNTQNEKVKKNRQSISDNVLKTANDDEICI